VVFDSCRIVEDSVYAALTTGRIYIWSRVSQYGLGHTNKTFINAASGEITFLVSSNKTIFVASGDCSVSKWNLATSGIGRWNVAEYLNLEAPPDEMSLSEDETLLTVKLADNSTYVVQTSTMTILSRSPVLNTPTMPPLDWIGIVMDPAQPNLVAMNGRVGHIQWIDPVRWKTMAMFDVTQENPPSRDSIDRPNYLWMNPYLLWLTPVSIIAIERRRDDQGKYLMKFIRREAVGSTTGLKIEGCIECTNRVSYIRSTLDEVPDPTKEQARSEEILNIDEAGNLGVFTRDSAETASWRLDMARSGRNWQRSNVISCSKIIRQEVATINAVGNGTYLLVWRLHGKLEVEHVIDSIPGAREVEWGPARDDTFSSNLLVVFHGGIAAYNPDAKAFLWAVAYSPELFLFVNAEAAFVHDHKTVYRVDCAQGGIERQHDFREPQDVVAVIGKKENFSFVGLSAEKGISLLKLNSTENSILGEVNRDNKQTPFSEVSKNRYEDEREGVQAKFVDFQTDSTARKNLLDGPAYTLAPIGQIASVFIRSCLARRREE